MAGEKDSRAQDIEDFSFLVALADAEYLDDWEMKTIRNLALEDGVIDEQEKEVLRQIFDRLTKDNMTPKTWKELQRFRAQYRI